MNAAACAPYRYDLPPERIAQRPIEPYDAAKLLVVDRVDGSAHPASSTSPLFHETRFSNLASLLQPKDLFVFNNTQVIPGRVFGSLPTGGKAELLLVEELKGGSWKAIGKPLKKILSHGKVVLPEGVTFTVEEQSSSKQIVGTFSGVSQAHFRGWLERNGLMPIPPYIRDGKGDPQDKVDYQTLFASRPGSIAAPTASLHFTPRLLEELRANWETLEVTLHVGPASFLSIWESDNGGEPAFTPPGAERLYFAREILSRLHTHRKRGGRVIAVGTTVVRYLESIAQLSENQGDGWLETELAILPGFEFRLVDALITNFHQPGSSHLSLVEAFIGREQLSRSYEFALAHDFRFLSYGDAQFLVKAG